MKVVNLTGFTVLTAGEHIRHASSTRWAHASLLEPFQRWYKKENFQVGKQSPGMTNLTYAFQNTVV